MYGTVAVVLTRAPTRTHQRLTLPSPHIHPRVAGTIAISPSTRGHQHDQFTSFVKIPGMGVSVMVKIRQCWPPISPAEASGVLVRGPAAVSVLE